MANIKINGNKYNNIERVNFVGADGTSKVSFMDASILENLASGIAIDEYHDTQITSILNKYVLREANIGVVDMPNVTSIVAQGFYGCKAREIRFEGLESLPTGSTFIMMTNLTKAVIGAKLTQLTQQVFNGCSALATLVLRYDGVVTMANDVLKNTAIANGTGYVYVPSAQVDNYKANSGWSAYANQIRAIEDYPDEVA